MIMKIHTNAHFSVAGYLIDEADEPLAIPDGSYKSQIKNKRNDAFPVFEFRTGGVSNGGTITRGRATIEGVERDVLFFDAQQSAIANLRPGAYHADLTRTDDPLWVIYFRVTVVRGITNIT